MKKSLIVVSAALLLGIGAAGTERLRYDSSVFASGDRVSGGRHGVDDYPPCVRGVREDRCIQLYERGVRRSYAEWRARHGVRGRAAVPSRTVRAYPVCRSRADDNCIQRSAVRRAAHSAQPVRRAATRRPARAAVRAAAPVQRPARRAQQPVRRMVRQPVQRVQRAPQPRPVQRRAPHSHPRGGGSNTPGI
jgi:hypothetical protein